MAQNQDINLHMESMGFHRRLGFFSFHFIFIILLSGWEGNIWIFNLIPASAINHPRKYIYVMNKHFYVLV